MNNQSINEGCNGILDQNNAYQHDQQEFVQTG
jgi:hypothetical protein